MVEVKSKLDNFFVGKQQYPFGDEIEKCLTFDSYEISTGLMEEQEGSYPVLLGFYTAGSKRMLRHTNLEGGQRILEIYPRSGILTLELLSKYPGVSVVGVEKSLGLQKIARYKFNQDEDAELKSISDPKLLEYWEKFRAESKKYRDQVQFINADFEGVGLEEEDFDHAISNQGMHWMSLSNGLSNAFGQLRRFLKKNGDLFWTTSSHFYNDPNLPTDVYGFKSNDFIRYVLEEVNKSIPITGNYLDLSKPIHTLDSLREISIAQGFETKQVATYPIPVDLQIFIKNHVPVIVRTLTPKDTSKEDLEKITQEAISKAITNPKALADITHKYDVNPVFRSFRI